jgi:ABC-type sugar transport system substrate-binding protein
LRERHAVPSLPEGEKEEGLMNPRSGIFALGTAFILVLAACGGSAGSGSGAKTYNVWYVNPLPNTPDWGRSGKLFTDGAAAGGYKATMVGPDKIDIPAMVGQIEQAITDKADGILTCPLDPAAFKSVIDKAKGKGIVVASIGCVDPNADFSIGTDNDAYGRVAADLIAQQTGGNAKVGIIGTDQTTPNQVKQVNAFKAQIAAKYPNMQVLTWESDNSDAGVAAQKIPPMIKAYPQMNYLWIIEGAAPGAVPSAFKEAGLTAGQVKVLAIDAQPSTLKAITDGWITATLNQCWFNASPQAAKRMIQKKTGTSQPSFIAIKVDPVTKDRLPYQGCPADYTTY